jgi:hypothetical protein
MLRLPRILHGVSMRPAHAVNRFGMKDRFLIEAGLDQRDPCGCLALMNGTRLNRYIDTYRSCVTALA